MDGWKEEGRKERDGGGGGLMEGVKEAALVTKLETWRCDKKMGKWLLEDKIGMRLE